MKKMFYLLILFGFIFVVPNLKSKTYTSAGYSPNKISKYDISRYSYMCGYNIELSIMKNKSFRSVYILYDAQNSNYVFVYALPDLDKFDTYEIIDKNSLSNNLLHFEDRSLIVDLVNLGKCPKHAYIDIEGSKNELCFDNNGTYCIKDDPGRLGTKFEGESSLVYTKVNTEDIDEEKFVDVDKNDYLYKTTCTFQASSNADNKELTKYTDSTFIFNTYKNNSDDIAYEFCYKTNTNCDKLIKPNETMDFARDFLIEGFFGGNNYNGKTKIFLSKEEANIIFSDTTCKKVNICINDENNITTKCDSTDLNTQNVEIKDYIEMIETNNGKIIGSGEILSPGMIKILNEVYHAIKIVSSLIAAALSMFEFAKVMSSEDKEGLKKAFKHLVIRVVVIILIFLLPTLVNLIGNLTGIGTLPSGLF